jgi:hypothetical protein
VREIEDNGVGADDVRIGEFINKSQNLMENRLQLRGDGRRLYCFYE